MHVHISTLQYIFLKKIKMGIQLGMFVLALLYLYQQTGFIPTLIFTMIFILVIIVEDLFENIEHEVFPDNVETQENDEE